MTQVADLLRREHELVLRFRNTLLLEQEALRSGKTHTLSEISAQKISLVDTLNQVGAERSRIISPNANAAIDMQTWLSAHPKETSAAKLWKELLTIAREARDINESNGNLINVLHQKTTDALSILTQGLGDRSLYGSNGQSSVSTGSRIIDSA